MTLALAKAWVDTAIRQPQPRADALRAFQRAAHDRSIATLLVGRELTRSRKAFLIRWDGLEMIIVELNKHQQEAWNVGPLEMLANTEKPAMNFPIVATVPLIGITDVVFDGGVIHNGYEPLSGTCQFQFEVRPQLLGTQWGLRLHYFHPEMKGQTGMMWYTVEPCSASGTLNFRFPPFFNIDSPAETVTGPFAVFLQVFIADNWVDFRNCRKISNVASAAVEFR